MPYNSSLKPSVHSALAIPREAPSGSFWYGTDSLWTSLGVNGVWNMRDNVLNGNGYRTKLVYWHRGFNWRTEPPELTVSARRLDRQASPVKAEHANAIFVSGETPAMMTAINIPTAGCWNVTAEYRGNMLNFVVSVEP